MTFAEKLRQLRESAGLTQAALADASGLPVGSIRNYEQGQREPLWDVLFKLTSALGTDCRAFAECVSGGSSGADAKRPRGRPKKSGG
jgi:transcriptional regulator with XRE-family HTH domain